MGRIKHHSYRKTWRCAGRGSGCRRTCRAPYPEYIGTGKWRVIGKTDLGRWLQVIFVYPEDEQVELDSLSISDLPFFMSGEAQVVCVIHSRELTHAEKKRSRKRRKE
jgi:hypothetical protein